MPQLPLVTLRDIARHASVSITTVSLALRNHPKIPPRRRQQIQEIAASMGYHPNPMAAALAWQRDHLREHPICAALAWINHWKRPERLRGYKEFDAYWRGAVQTAERFGYRLEEFVISSDLTLPKLAKVLEIRNIQGILLPPHGAAAGESPDWAGFPWEQFSIVRFGYSLQEPRVHLVTANQIGNSLDAVSNMQNRGYQRIGFLACSANYSRIHAGFLMAQAKIASSSRVPPLCLSTSLHHDTDLRQLQRWIERHQPDAILTDLSDMRRMLDEIGLRVPEDIGLATLSVLDGNADAGVFQNSEEIGKVAMETLISLMHGNHRGIPEMCRETLVQGIWQDGSTLPNRKVVS